MTVKQRRNTTKHKRGPGRPFERGDSRINRAGRPKLAASLAEAIREAGAEDVGGESRRDRVIRILWERAEDDRDVAALLFNRGWGRVSEMEVLERIAALEVRLNGNGASAA